MDQSDFFKKLTETHPFISVCSYAGKEYVGIIQNRDEIITSLYDYGSIVYPELKEKFLELGDIWWGESNRKISINLFLKSEWNVFKPYLRTFNNKSLILLHGPACSMLDLNNKKSKRKSITLVKRMN